MAAVRNNRALHAIALVEAVKGALALAASAGLLSLAHHDIRATAYALIGHFHLDPEQHYPQLLLNYADTLGNTGLRTAVLLAWAYAALRFTEGYGLWRARAWAEWLAALSGGIYLPLEIGHLLHHTTIANSLVLAVNLGVVVYMLVRLWQRRQAKQHAWG